MNYAHENSRPGADLKLKTVVTGLAGYLFIERLIEPWLQYRHLCETVVSRMEWGMLAAVDDVLQ